MRKPNITYNAQKLDDAIRAIDGERYNKSNISTFICGCANTYYNGCMSDGKISEDALKRICKFYGLKYKDFLEVPKPEPVKVESPVDPNAEITDAKATPAAPAVVNVDLTAITNVVNSLLELSKSQSDAIMAQLLAINKAVAELASQQKSTNYLVGQSIDKLGTINKHADEILSLTKARENRFTKSANVKKIG